MIDPMIAISIELMNITNTKIESKVRTKPIRIN